MKYKICVYAICKNEEKFVNRWVDSMKEADEIYVLDTGSTDNTVKLLKEKNVHVKIEKIDPWRFDNARNKSLELIPKDADICICTDLDEVFEKGWRKKLEKHWKKNTTRARYNYNWLLDENENPKVNFYIEKAHNRNDYIWTHPVHEVLTYIGKKSENTITIDDITINHYPDNQKSRKSYLPLLELSVKEDPEDDRNMHYLGREYMYYGRWNEAIDTLIKHLKLKSATWKDERCASMRFIARCYKFKGDFKESLNWYDSAIKEAPYLRDPYIEKALLLYETENWDDLIDTINMALKINNHQKTYINEIFSWNETPYDLLSIAYYNKKEYVKSLINVDKALMLSNEIRLKNNQKIIIEKIENLEK